MDIQASAGLEPLIELVQTEITAAIEEREELGLYVPKPPKVMLTFYAHEGAAAQARPSDPNHVIAINTLPIIGTKLHESGEEKASDVVDVMNYFDIAREFLGNSDETIILRLIDDPETTIARVEEKLGQESLEYLRSFFRERGTTYETYKSELIKDARKVRKNLVELLPEILRLFPTINIHSQLRHELDHVALFDSPIHVSYNRKVKVVQELRRELARGEKELSKGLGEANLELLRTTSEVDPLTEVRATFFDYVNPDEWDKANYEEVTKQVFTRLHRDYIEGSFAEPILDKLVSHAWGTGDMNRATSNHLFYLVTRQVRTAGQLRYCVDPREVNFEVVDEILYSDLPKWKREFSRNGRIAAEAIADALGKDPTRLRAANDAETFDDFIRIARAA